MLEHHFRYDIKANHLHNPSGEVFTSPNSSFEVAPFFPGWVGYAKIYSDSLRLGEHRTSYLFPGATVRCSELCKKSSESPPRKRWVKLPAVVLDFGSRINRDSHIGL